MAGGKELGRGAVRRKEEDLQYGGGGEEKEVQEEKEGEGCAKFVPVTPCQTRQMWLTQFQRFGSTSKKN